MPQPCLLIKGINLPACSLYTVVCGQLTSSWINLNSVAWSKTPGWVPRLRRRGKLLVVCAGTCARVGRVAGSLAQGEHRVRTRASHPPAILDEVRTASVCLEVKHGHQSHTHSPATPTQCAPRKFARGAVGAKESTAGVGERRVGSGAGLRAVTRHGGG